MLGYGMFHSSSGAELTKEPGSFPLQLTEARHDRLGTTPIPCHWDAVPLYLPNYATGNFGEAEARPVSLGREGKVVGERQLQRYIASLRPWWFHVASIKENDIQTPRLLT